MNDLARATTSPWFPLLAIGVALACLHSSAFMPLACFLVVFLNADYAASIRRVGRVDDRRGLRALRWYTIALWVFAAWLMIGSEVRNRRGPAWGPIKPPLTIPEIGVGSGSVRSTGVVTPDGRRP